MKCTGRGRAQGSTYVVLSIVGTHLPQVSVSSRPGELLVRSPPDVESYLQLSHV